MVKPLKTKTEAPSKITPQKASPAEKQRKIKIEDENIKVEKEEESHKKETDFTLRRGNKGMPVSSLQESLKRLGIELFVDGVFGNETEHAVKEFQKSNGLEPTGIANQQTQDLLRSVSQDKSESTSIKLHAVSDRPLEGKDDDSLGFAPYVDAMVAFLRSKDTQPPLAIGINAPWGRGKTSFMNMLESELKVKSQWFGPVRFATEWFNPWKYSNDEQVWAAFVAVITKCIRGGLGLWGRIKFETLRFYNNIQNRKIAFLIRLVVFAAVCTMFFIIAFDPQMKNFALTLVANQWGDNVKIALETSWVGRFIPWLGGVILAFLLYTKVIRVFNIDLLDYLKTTNFKNKIGTLTQFEKEMNLLNACMPKKSKLKVVIFVDDLDRCNPAVLWEVIEALQLLAVSKRTIFILGMDLKIVANTINVNYPKLSQELTEFDGTLQHGWGYRFLEKVIQTRLSVPAYGLAQLNNLVLQTLGTEEVSDIVPLDNNEQVIIKNHEPEAFASTDSSKEIPRDSYEVVETVSQYGPDYFKNPRRLKRFINNFRLHAYLANMTGFAVSLDRLARFLILIEKWPGLVEFFRTNPRMYQIWQEKKSIPEQPDTKSDKMLLIENAVSLLRNPSIVKLFMSNKANQKDTLNYNELDDLCNWYGFRYYK
jgi:hypothetical protein